MVAPFEVRSRTFDEMALLEKLTTSDITVLREQLTHLDRYQEVMAASEQWVWDTETHHLNGADITVSSAFYGLPLNSPAEILEYAKKTMALLGVHNVPDYTEQTGFPKLRQMTHGLTDADYQLTQELVAEELLIDALDRQEIDAREVDLFIAVTSIPIGPNFGREWARAGGIPDEVPVIRICEACNSSGHAMEKVLSGEFDDIIAHYNPNFKKGKPANIVLFALDDANRFADRGGDALSPQFFSTGAAAMIWKYHPDTPSSFKMIMHKSRSEERGTEHLLVPRPYDRWSDQDREGLYTAKYLKEPDHEGPVTMHPRASVSFRRYALELGREVMSEYAEKGGQIIDIKRVIIHHPSKSVFDSVKASLLEDGFSDDQLHWVINEGNVPVATIPIAFGRQLEDLAPGDRVLFLSFGAGGEYTCFIADIGQTEAVH